MRKYTKTFIKERAGVIYNNNSKKENKSQSNQDWLLLIQSKFSTFN